MSAPDYVVLGLLGVEGGGAIHGMQPVQPRVRAEGGASARVGLGHALRKKRFSIFF